MNSSLPESKDQTALPRAKLSNLRVFHSVLTKSFWNELKGTCCSSPVSRDYSRSKLKGVVTGLASFCGDEMQPGEGNDDKRRNVSEEFLCPSRAMASEAKAISWPGSRSSFHHSFLCCATPHFPAQEGLLLCGCEQGTEEGNVLSPKSRQRELRSQMPSLILTPA